MLFNSYIFVLLFFPLCITGWFVIHSAQKPFLAQLFLLSMSLWFYGYFNIKYLWLIIASIVFNYGIYVFLNQCSEKKIRKLALFAGVAFNLGLLFYYKYFDFFLENINDIFATDFILKKLILPLGISFFTFQQMSFVIDAYKGEVPQYDFLNYALFVTYFPQLIAGPIVTHDELVPQFANEEKHKINWDNILGGGICLLWVWQKRF